MALETVGRTSNLLAKSPGGKRKALHLVYPSEICMHMRDFVKHCTQS
jgi:hypothetical protein